MNSKITSILTFFFQIMKGYDFSNMRKNYYSVLEAPRHSNAIDIRKAYKRVSLKSHPDKNPVNADATGKFEEIKLIYDVS